MKAKKVSLEKNGDAVYIKFKKHTNKSQLKKCRDVIFTGIIKSPELNTVGVSVDVYNELRGSGMVLLNPCNGKYIEVVLTPLPVGEGKIKIANYVAESLAAEEGDGLILIENDTRRFSAIRIQKIENIKEDNIVISSKDNSGVPVDLDEFCFYQLFNYYTGESVIVKKSHIRIDGHLDPGTILLNKKQRTFLGLELPKHISGAYWEELVSGLPEDSAELKLLKEAYPTSDRFLKSDLEYETKQKLLKIISACCKPCLCFAPVVDSYYGKIKRGLRAIADFYVGKSTISLLCRRPYESDEGSDIVRMTASNMNLLGITEMDKIVIRYKDKSIKCRVLELDDEQLFLDSNLPAPINYVIGIPVHLRKKLGICNVNTAVKVDRDTPFIFKKSINEQIVPILLTVFSINLFDDPSIWKKALVSLLSIPIVVYLNLSSKRNMRG